MTENEYPQVSYTTEGMSTEPDEFSYDDLKLLKPNICVRGKIVYAKRREPKPGLSPSISMKVLALDSEDEDHNIGLWHNLFMPNPATPEELELDEEDAKDYLQKRQWSFDKVARFARSMYPDLIPMKSIKSKGKYILEGEEISKEESDKNNQAYNAKVAELCTEMLNDPSILVDNTFFFTTRRNDKGYLEIGASMSKPVFRGKELTVAEDPSEWVDDEEG